MRTSRRDSRNLRVPVASSRLKYRVASVNDLIQYLCEVAPHDTESLSLQIMACRKQVSHQDKLLQTQSPSGAWFTGNKRGPENCFHTALALMALRSTAAKGHVPLAVTRAFGWLDSMAGVENHWLWKWKFRYFDWHVRFDPNKSGWPWVEGTVSWVAPTAMVLLAHRAWQRESPRLATAQKMLLDRACPQGGWNAGNGEVFGVPLEPHPDFTSMALLALNGSFHRNLPTISKAQDYLSNRLIGTGSLYSLAWATLALNAWNHRGGPIFANRLRDRLAFIEFKSIPVYTLSLVSLACEDPTFSFTRGRI